MTARTLLLLAVALLASCERAPAPPPAPPSAPRIVALSPGLAVTLRDLGHEDAIVGRHGYDLVLDPSIPVCGDLSGIDYEALVRADPTHIAIEWGHRPIPSRLSDLARERGWKVMTYAFLTLDDIEVSARGLYTEFAPVGAPPWPETDLAAALETAWAPRANDFGPVGRVLLLGAVDPPTALGPGSWHHEILVRVGGQPAITAGTPYMTRNAEDILRLAPDAIILILPRAPGAPPAPPSADDLIATLGRVGTLDIPAVRAGRIALIDDPLALTPSTAMIGLADAMARILESWNTPAPR